MRRANKVSICSIHLSQSRIVLAAMALTVGLALWVAQAPAVSADPPVISTDGFESGAFSGGSGWEGGWNADSSVDIVSDEGPHSGARHIRMRGWANLERTIQLSGPTDMELSFWAKADSLEDGDTVSVEVSGDGNAWTVLESWTHGEDDNQYRRYVYDLSGLGFSQQVYLRFQCNSNDSSDYFFVDDVDISGEPVNSDDPPEDSSGLPEPPPEPPPAEAANIVIDGQFADWDGHPNLPDPQGDASRASGDMSALYWANNSGSEVNYWMIERYLSESNANYEDNDPQWHNWQGWGNYNHNSQARKVRYIIHVDTDNDGQFDEWADRRVYVYYHPRWSDSEVRVKVKRGKGGQTLFSSNGDWGDSITEGGRRVELQVPWTQLGITSGSVIRMYVTSDRNDRLPDGGDIQWSPASILGYWLLASLLAIGSTIFWRVRKKREAACPSG